ncbi:MAG: amidase family protein [Lysobacterales bacterium]
MILIAILLPTSDLCAQARGFDAFELTIPELQAAMANGETTSQELVSWYLERINAFDHEGPRLNAVIYINPHALEEAAALDKERAEKGPRGPLHGIPVLLKDNYDTFDMPTTASSVAMTGSVPPDDAYQVRKLREAGAVFIGKTNLHEFARGIETVSSLGGQTLNPYDPSRNPGGSSGGTAAAVTANFAAVGMGSDTCGSIRIPAAQNNLYGLRVTQGLSSRDGIIPLSHTQDVGGPLARSMIDLVTVLDATVGPDPADEQSLAATGHVPESYTEFLQKDALKNARLGLLSGYLDTQSPFGEVSKIIRQATEVMAENGSEIIEISIEGLDELLKDTSVIDIEFRFDLARYLEQSNAPVKSLPEILESGNYLAVLESRYRRSLKTDENSEDYRNRLANREKVERLLVEAMTANKLDALVYPTLRVKAQHIGEPQYASLCRIAAHSGLPAISVPAGFTPDGLPIGIELLAIPFGEARLVALAYAWEQVAKPRRPPPRTPSLLNDQLVYPFVLDSPAAGGQLSFRQTTQILSFALQTPDLAAEDILDIKVHRGAVGTNGPIVALLGDSLQGAWAVPNAEVNNLLGNRLYLVVYTRGSPFGAFRGQILRH